MEVESEYTIFDIDFFLLNVLFLRSTDVVANLNSLFLFIAEVYGMNVTQFV